MARAISRQLTIVDLVDDDPTRNTWQTNQVGTLAGRCLLDVVGYIRRNLRPAAAAQYGQLVNAHCMRMVINCLDTLPPRHLAGLKPHIARACRDLMSLQSNHAPHFGDDYWDWAYILDALTTVGQRWSDICPVDYYTLQLNALYEAVATPVLAGQGSGELTFGSDKEWFGPAVPTAVYRVLKRLEGMLGQRPQVSKLLTRLKKDALVLVGREGEYLGRPMMPKHLLSWHYGQVVSQFPASASPQHLKVLTDLNGVVALQSQVDQAYGLARIIQGTHAIGDKATTDLACRRLYEFENMARPFGDGLICEKVKASVNLLEALWSLLGTKDSQTVSSMLQAFMGGQKPVRKLGKKKSAKVGIPDRFRVVLSFASEKSPFVSEVAEHLRRELGADKVFFDSSFKSHLGRPDAQRLFRKIYSSESDLFVVFFSPEYEKKPWCRSEFAEIHKLFGKKSNRIMLFRFQKRKVTMNGITDSDVIIWISKSSTSEVADMILERLKAVPRAGVKTSVDRS